MLPGPKKSQFYLIPISVSPRKVVNFTYMYVTKLYNLNITHARMDERNRAVLY